MYSLFSNNLWSIKLAFCKSSISSIKGVMDGIFSFEINLVQILNRLITSFSDLVIERIMELKTLPPYIFCNSGISFNKASKSIYSLPDLAFTTDAFCLISNETP